MTLMIGSLFSGIGGLELGLEWAGLGPVVWQVEQDDYCRRVLAKHWPDATRYEDVCHVGRSNLATVDVICGGFPCQDISLAGEGAGLSGARSGLWSEYARIVRELQPRYVVVENVAALLSQGLGIVLGDLATLGYDAWWDCLPASGIGAPHQRDRLFIVAYVVADAKSLDVARRRHTRADQRNAEQQAAVPEGLANDVSDTNSSGRRARKRDVLSGQSHVVGSCKTVANPDSCDAQGLVAERDDAQHRGISRERPSRLRSGAREHQGWETEPSMGRVAHGIPSRVDRLKSLGNAVVPQVAEIVGQVILARENAKRGAA